jgi:hypothetical protein
MTLALNIPINLAVLRLGEERGDPDRWRQLRRRWDQIQTHPRVARQRRPGAGGGGGRMADASRVVGCTVLVSGVSSGIGRALASTSQRKLGLSC